MLVVEDEMLVALLVEDVLADAGCIVIGPFARVGDALAAATAEVIGFGPAGCERGGREGLPGGICARGTRRAVSVSHRLWASRAAPGPSALGSDLQAVLPENACRAPRPKGQGLSKIGNALKTYSWERR